jgi:hypothetical protein
VKPCYHFATQPTQARLSNAALKAAQLLPQPRNDVALRVQRQCNTAMADALADDLGLARRAALTLWRIDNASGEARVIE